MINAARVWFVVCACLAVAGPIAVWDRFVSYFHHLGSSALALTLVRNGFYASEAIAQTVLLIGLAIKAVVFVFCVGLLVYRGRKQPFHLVLAGGFLAYGIGVLLPVDHAPDHFRWLFDVNLNIAASTLALATLTLPSGEFKSQSRVAYWVFWVAVVWLVLHPPGAPWRWLHHWNGLHGIPRLRAWIHIALLSGGLAALGRRHVTSGHEARLQTKWVVVGIGASVVAFAINNALHAGEGADVFAMLVQPVLQGCAVLAITVAVIKDGLGNLKDHLPRFFRVVFFIVAVGGATLALQRFAVSEWRVEGHARFVAFLATFALSLGVAYFGRTTLAQVVDYLLFPSTGDREEAIALGQEALADTLEEAEVLWAVVGIFEHGWPGCEVEVWRGKGLVLHALGSTRKTKPFPSELTGDYCRVAGEPRAADQGREPPATLWLRLSVPKGNVGARESIAPGETSGPRDNVGALRLVPSAEGFSDADLVMFMKIVPAVSQAVWRASQQYTFRSRERLARE